jgi:hypothetical protein
LEVFRTNENYKSNGCFGAVLVNGIFPYWTSNINGGELAGLSRADKTGNIE